MSDLRKAAKMALEFVEWFASDDHSIRPNHKAPEIAEALRQALAQSEWVGLTDDEINHTPVRFTMINGPGDYLLPFARAIEAKLKEKNT